jgi:ABC-type transport system involved in multi-copper enzyme maturation permease subunit
MMRAFRSEWAKFLRRGQVLGSWGVMVGFAVLFTVLFFSFADANAPPVTGQGQGGGPPAINTSVFEEADGWAFGFQVSGGLLGIIVLVVSAANLATEYTAGTLKTLLVREPRRMVLVTGKAVAVASFVAAGITLALVASVGASVAMAAVKGIETSAWWTMEGVVALLKSYVHVTLACWVWQLMGMMLAAVFRSGFAAIGIGIGYPLVVESILQLVLPDVAQWMPGSVLGAFMAGNTASALGDAAGIAYAQAAALSLAYAVAFLAVTLVLVLRRDVT